MFDRKQDSPSLCGGKPQGVGVTRRQVATSVVLLTLTAASSLPLTGCGGGGGGSAVHLSSTDSLRSVTVSVAWPAAITRKVNGRDLPVSANSVQLIITDSGGYSESQTLNKPATSSTSATASFIGLRSGTLQISAVAFSGTDASGTAVDTASTTTTVNAGASGSVQLSFPNVAFHQILIQVPSGSSANLPKNQSLTLTAIALDTNGLTISAVSGAWATSDATIVTVDSTGKITAVNPGKATITFTEASTGLQATLVISVDGLIDVVVTPGPTDTVSLFGTLALTATGDDVSGSQVASPAGTWASSNTGTATVSHSGVVTAVGAGTASISFTDSTYGKVGTITVTVPVDPIAAIHLTPTADQTVLQGSTTQLAASAYDAQGRLLTTTPAGAWTSSSPSIASVSATGVVTALLPGQTTITFTDSTFHKSAGLLFTVKGGDSQVTIQ